MMENRKYSTVLDGRTVRLGETKMGAADYIRSFGGLIVDVLGQSAMMRSQFPLLEKDPRSGLLVTQSHADVARLATATCLYFDMRCRRREQQSEVLRSGLRARFADFNVDSAPSAVYTAVIQPGHETVVLDSQAFMQDDRGLYFVKERVTKIEGANENTVTLLTQLAQYHQK